MNVTPSFAERSVEETIWDSIEAGHSFDSSSRTVTETDVVNFACLSGDFNRLHVDAEYARSTPFNQRIAHALLVLSISSGLATQSRGYRELEPTLIAATGMHCRFLKPTFIGDTLFVRVTVVDKTPSSKPGRARVTLRRESINQRGETVLEADFAMLVKVGTPI